MSDLAADDPSALRGDPALRARIAQAIDAGEGWLRFDDYMRLALYAPGLGYYASGRRTFGRMASDGSDFVTAPELTPLFAAALAVQVRQVLDASAPEVMEFGAGSGRLAADLLVALDDACRRYAIVEVSGTLRARQRETIARLAPSHVHKVVWLDALPEYFRGCIVGNEVLDAMPVRLVRRYAGTWRERGVVRHGARLAWDDRSIDTVTRDRIAHEVPNAAALPDGYVVELHDEAEAFVATLAHMLAHGAMVFLDYGFPAHEYFHPQRVEGTLVCHAAHRVHDDPLDAPGHEDITAHVDFSAIARAAVSHGMRLAGYATQARFLMNCGILDALADHGPAGSVHYLRAASDVLKLLSEAEMGELFKAIAFTRELDLALIGFADGDRSAAL